MQREAKGNLHVDQEYTFFTPQIKNTSSVQEKKKQTQNWKRILICIQSLSSSSVIFQQS